uniref:F-box domain-containing protein n=1 Tax=Elaeophora elaphi TaxID=1147741 RepID=A0A0R3RFU8_9BILA
MQRILISQIDCEQVPEISHIYNTLRVDNDPTQTHWRSATLGRNSFMSGNTETDRVTNFFAVRKRRSSEEDNYSLNGKKNRACGTLGTISTSSSQLVPSCDFFDDKENGIAIVNFSVRRNLTSPSAYILLSSSYNPLKNVEQLVPDAMSNTPLGIFQMLPPELLCVMFDHIPVLQLKQLSLSSSALSTKIRGYISMAGTHQRFFDETAAICDVGFESAEDPFHDWGMLLKACTMVMSFHNGHVFLAKFFNKNKNVEKWYGWGRCFMAVSLNQIFPFLLFPFRYKFCKGWTYDECEELFRSVMRFTGLNGMLSRAMSKRVKNYRHLEIEVRVRLRGFFLSCNEKDDECYGFWISAILRTQKTIAQQGRLFMIIFGPLKLGEGNYDVIDWELLSTTTIEDRHLCEKIIGPMSFSVHSMITNENLKGYSWSDHHLFNLIEEITTAPYPWTLDNFAAFLALRPKLIHIALYARIIHGHQEEAAHLFHAINSACTCIKGREVLHQWGIFSSAAITSVILKTFRALSDIRRRLFLSSFLRTESELLSDALMSDPFDRDYFYMELAVGRAVSPLVTLMASNI